MKLSNIFKKETKIVAKVAVQTLNKKQLEMVIGGDDGLEKGVRLKKVIDGDNITLE